MEEVTYEGKFRIHVAILQISPLNRFLDELVSFVHFKHLPTVHIHGPTGNITRVGVLLASFVQKTS
jgi:hypothetical protein